MGGEPSATSALFRGVPGKRAQEPAALRPRDPAVMAVWGVVNVTPDSFSDGGRYLDPEPALGHAARMLADGAEVIDVGGESSRPAGASYGVGASPVPVDEELRRVVPVVEGLVRRGAAVSIDTVKPEVARAALAAGASVVNDVSGGVSAELLEVVAAAGAELVLMHSRDGGRVDADSTAYGEDVVGAVLEALLGAAARAEERGVARDRIWIDPGIGFAKTALQSAALLGNLDAFVRTGYPVLVGASRKSFIARLAGSTDGGEPSPERRLGGSLVAVTAAALAGCAAVRVHDVFESVQAARVAEAIAARGPTRPVGGRA